MEATIWILNNLIIQSFISFKCDGQILFSEDCFVGGVTTAGLDNVGVGYKRTCKIKWEENYTLLKAYAVSYRYGRPHDQIMRINGGEIQLSLSNQAGPEQIETNNLGNCVFCSKCC